MKHFSFLFLILLFFVSCAQDQKNGTDLIRNSSRKYEIRTIVKVDGIAWFSRMREGVFKFSDESGMDSSLTGPSRADADLQVKLIEEAIEEKVDAICVIPFDVQVVEPALKKARDAGIIVVAHEASNLINADLIIEAFDNASYGIHLMDHLSDYMNQKGEYLVFVGSYGSKSQMEWATAAVIHQKEKYPQMSVSGEWIECYDDQAIVYDETLKALKENPNIKGILGAPMPTASGAGTAVQAWGLSHEVSVVSTGLVSICSELLEDGSVDLISFWDPADAGYVMNILAVMLLEDKPIEDGLNLFTYGYENLKQDPVKKNLYYGSSWTDVTKENMNNYAF